MNEFFEIHKRVLIFLGVLLVATAILWFALGSSLYAGMTRSEIVTKDKYTDYKSFYGRGLPVDVAEGRFNSELTASKDSLAKLKASIEMRFHDYIRIPAEQSRTKLPYFDKMLYEVRENLNMLASVNRIAMPQNIGWPDFIDVPIREHDTVVPELLKKLSVTDKALTLLISSRTGNSRVKEIQEIKIGDPYNEPPSADYPDFVRHYPITITFVSTINALMKFLGFVHYVDSPERKLGQFFEVEYISVAWNDDNPTSELKVTVRLNAIEFIQTAPVESGPKATTDPGKPLGY